MYTIYRERSKAMLRGDNECKKANGESDSI